MKKKLILAVIAIYCSITITMGQEYYYCDFEEKNNIEHSMVVLSLQKRYTELQKKHVPGQKILENFTKIVVMPTVIIRKHSEKEIVNQLLQKKSLLMTVNVLQDFYKVQNALYVSNATVKTKKTQKKKLKKCINMIVVSLYLACLLIIRFPFDIIYCSYNNFCSFFRFHCCFFV